MSNERGFIALVSVLLVSVILLLVVMTEGTRAFLSRFNSLDTEFALQARHNADTCTETARLLFKKDSSYVVDTALALPYGSCSITKITQEAESISFFVEGIWKQATSAREVVLDLHDFSFTQKEIPNSP
ncbi:MAG: hypothetical protein WAV21_01415 [Minisyncoccia bacterium]